MSHALARRSSPLLLCVAVLASACEAPSARTIDPQEAVEATSAALTAPPIIASNDTSLREAQPNANDGIGTNLGVSATSGSRERTLVRFETSAINSAASGKSLYSAYVEFTINTLSAGWGGGKIGLHRMTRTWSQGNGTYFAIGSSGPSWRCANDTDTSLVGNLTNNCTAANGWSMEPPAPPAVPYDSVATDSVPLYSNGMTTVRFDVTADVQQILSGGANNGWMVKSAGGALSGASVQFSSRETLSGPRLIMDVGADLCATDATKTTPGQCGCGVPDTDTDGDRIADCLEPTLLPVADTTLRLALPFGNDGLGSKLEVTSASVVSLQRTLLRFDQTQLVNAVHGLTVHSAKIQLTVSGISVGWGGGPINITRMTRAWPEGNGTDTILGAHGPSWVCADDANTANLLDNCTSANRWGMRTGDLSPLPFVSTPTASAAIATGGPTTITFDVTSDVVSFLSGTPNQGWIIKGTDSLLSGAWVDFGSRESTTPPKLVLDLSASPPPPSSIPAPTGLPDVGCVQRRNADVNYFVCNTPRSFEVAQHNCERVGMKLVSVDQTAEDTWLGSAITQPVWIGAQETNTPGTWAWLRSGQTIWAGGAAAPGAFNKWNTGEPDGGAPGSCAARATGAAGRWVTDECFQSKAYVCEGSSPESKMDEIGLYTSLVTQYVMCRVGQGHAQSDLELAVLDQITHDAGANTGTVLSFLSGKCAAFQAACTNVDTQLMLNDLAGFDPCDMTGPLTKDDVRGAMDQLVAGARLREDFCATGDRHITVRHTDLTPQGPDSNGEVTSAASPWIVGVDPVRADPNAFFGDHTITEDWDKKRSNPALGDDTGDGLSPFGVKTLDSSGNPISCAASEAICDAAQGQICGNRIGQHENVCFSFPVVTHGEEIRLRGYNFWDTHSAQLGFTRLIDPANRLAQPNVTVIPSDDCRSPVNSRTNLFAEGIQPDQATGIVPVDGGYFYEVRIFNKNGNYFTTFDEPGTGPTADPGRTIHTCWSACNPLTHQCPSSCANFSDIHCAVQTCVPPTNQTTCSDDGRLPDGGCASEWTSPPRELTTLDSFNQRQCQTEIWDSPRCEETPWWFGSHPTRNRAIVYVQAKPPEYEFRTRLDVVKCIEESGWSWPGDDEFVATLTAFPLDGRKIDELINTPAADIPDGFSATFKGDFDEGDRKPSSATSNMPVSPAFRSLNSLLTSTRVGPGGLVMYRLSLRESDADVAAFNDAISGTLKIVGTIVAAADLVFGCEGYCALAGGIIVSVSFILDAALSPYESDDDLGKTSWGAAVNEFNQRIVTTHSLSAGGFRNSPALPITQVDTNGDGIADTTWGSGTITTQLMNPMDFSSRYLDHPDLCTCSENTVSCPNDTVAFCHPTNGACYAGRCIGGDPYVAASPAEFTPTCANDQTCNRGFRERIDIKRSKESSRYSLDFKFELQRQNASTGVFDVDPI